MASPAFPSLPIPHIVGDYHSIIASARALVDQPPPPTLREILGAYRAKGDGDRDMLFAMLNAKSAEDQRLASVASLQKSLLDIYQANMLESQQSSYAQPRLNGAHPYPIPSHPQESPQFSDRKPHRLNHHSQHQHHHRVSSSSRSPHIHHPYASTHADHISRKRYRSSHSPPPHAYHDSMPIPPASQPERFPPSPYSSSGRSESAEYSPRSRASMAIGALLTTGPKGQEPAADDS